MAGIEDEGRPVSTRENGDDEETAPPQEPRLGRDEEEVLAHLPPTTIRQWWSGASADGGGAIFRVSVLAVFRGGTRPRGERRNRGERRELVRGGLLALESTRRRAGRAMARWPCDRGRYRAKVRDDRDDFVPSPLEFSLRFANQSLPFSFFCFNFYSMQ